MSSSSSMFFTICVLHSAIAIACGFSIMFRLEEISSLGYGSTPHDRLLIETSYSFSGLLLCSVGSLVFMVGFVKDREFQSFFAKGCVVLHVAMAVWRVWFERRVEDLARDWPKQVAGDFLLGSSWGFFLAYNWREMYD